MAAAIGWYGPLIDLCKASSHIGDYVQLVVFIHKSTPIQYKIARNGGEVVRLDILVGDETRVYFPVTIWQQQLVSEVIAGHVYLLQNVKITKFGDTVEAKTLHCSSIQCLFSSKNFIAPEGIDESIRECPVGMAARDKLQKVVGWVQQARLTNSCSQLHYFEYRRQLKVNWKVHEETQSQDCFSLSDLSHLKNSCRATFHASIGEIFLPISWINLRETEAERMFISRRLHLLFVDGLIDDLITTGCQLCGTPVNSRSSMMQNNLFCQRSSDRHHVIGAIYRSFLLYVWDDSKCVPLLVTNKAAELLFGNIQAEKVYSCYKIQRQQQQQRLCPKNSVELNENNSREVHVDTVPFEKPNFYMVWLILLKTLFQRGNHTPLKFQVTVDTNKDWESGKFQMISVSIPVFES